MTDASQLKWHLRAYFDDMAPIYDSFGPLWYNLAKQMLQFNPHPLGPASLVHDNACGNGAVTVTIARQLPAHEMPTIHATDISPAMIRECRKRPEFDSGRLIPAEMDSESLAFPDATFTHSFCSLVLMACTGPGKIAKEMYRTLQPGGVALATVWRTCGYAPIADAAIHAVRADAPTYTGPTPPHWLTADWFQGLFTDAGFAADKIQLHKTTETIVISKDADENANKHHFDAIVLKAAATWSDAEKQQLYQELEKRFVPELGGFESGVWHLVAVK